MMKRRKEYPIFFTFFLLSNVCWGQFAVLNKYFALGEYTILRDIVSHGDSITALAEVFDPLLLNEQNACLIRADTFGNIAKIVYFYIPNYDSPHLLSRNAKLTSTSDGGFVFSGQIFFKPYSITIVKVNHNMEIEFIKELLPEGGTTFPQKVIETKDAYYIGLWLGYGPQDKDAQYCIVKTDLQGNELWHKFYGTEDNYEFLFNIKSFKEGEITMLGNKGLNNKGRMALTTIDTSGAVIKEIYNDGDNEGNIYDIDTLSNGDYIYICSELKNVTDYRSSLRVYRITSEGEVVWKKVINDFVLNAFIYRMHRNTNGTYTIIGQEDGVGRSLCIDKDGDILWQHLYYLPFSPMPIPYYSSLLGMTALPSGNIIACGYFRDQSDPTYQEQGWLLKMDANGCIDKNCRTLLGGQEVIQIDELKVGVYPNPSDGRIKVNIPYDSYISESMIQIYDIVGNKLISKKLNAGINEVNMSNKISSGILIYNVNDGKGNVLKTGKLIITK